MANDLFKTNVRMFGMKKEAVSGVAETIETTDLDMRLNSLELGDYGIEFDETSGQYLNGKHTKEKAVAGVARGAIDFSINLARGEFNYDGSGGYIDHKFPIGKALEATGCISVVNEPTDEATSDGDVVWHPSMSADNSTVTASLFEKRPDGIGIEYKVAGGMCTLSIGAESVGAPIKASFNVSGGAEGAVENSTVSFDESNVIKTSVLPYLNTKVQIHELDDLGQPVNGAVLDLCTNNFNLDTGIALGELLCQNTASGFTAKGVDDRVPVLTVNPVLRAVSDFDFWSAMKEGKTYKIGITQEDEAGNVAVFLVVPRGQLRATANNADGANRRNTLTFNALTNIGLIDGLPEEADWALQIAGVNRVQP